MIVIYKLLHYQADPEIIVQKSIAPGPIMREQNGAWNLDQMTEWPTAPIPSAIQNVLKCNTTKHNTYWLLVGKKINSVSCMWVSNKEIVTKCK